MKCINIFFILKNLFKLHILFCNPETDSQSDFRNLFGLVRLKNVLPFTKIHRVEKRPTIVRPTWEKNQAKESTDKKAPLQRGDKWGKWKSLLGELFPRSPSQPFSSPFIKLLSKMTALALWKMSRYFLPPV